LVKPVVDEAGIPPVRVWDTRTKICKEVIFHDAEVARRNKINPVFGLPFVFSNPDEKQIQIFVAIDFADEGLGEVGILSFDFSLFPKVPLGCVEIPEKPGVKLFHGPTDIIHKGPIPCFLSKIRLTYLSPGPEASALPVFHHRRFSTGSDEAHLR
jgi:hypothetical protein